MIIKSKILKQKLEFYIPGDHYVYVDIVTNKTKKVISGQICHGGEINYGSTVSYFDKNEAGFKKLCKNWYRKYLANQNKEG